jgi:GntR family mannosyl-D-glycerate transport/metabolism transcriptional repressor
MEFGRLEISKYSYIEQITGKKIQRRDQQLNAINVTDGEQLRLLNFNANEAALEINETVYLDDGMPCEVNIAIINTKLLQLRQNTERG